MKSQTTQTGLSKNPKVSICIVTYNHEKYIKDCLLSVIAQKCDFDIEILVGNDHSSDRTSELIERVSNQHPGLIRHFFNEKNLGPSENCQNIVKHAAGEYIAHLDGDDFWLPGKLEAQVQFLEKNKELAAVYTNAIVITEDKEMIGYFNNRQPEKFDTSYLLRKLNFLINSSILYRSSCKDALLGIKERYMDYRLHLRLSLKGQLGYINQALTVYRCGVLSSASSTEKPALLEMEWEALLSLKPELTNLEPLYTGLVRFWFYNMLLAARRYDFYKIYYWTKRILTQSGIPIGTFLISSAKLLLSDIQKDFFKKILSSVTRPQLRIVHKR